MILFCFRSSKSNGSITTLERVKREESHHNIGSFSHTSSGQVQTNRLLFLPNFWSSLTEERYVVRLG